MNYEIVKYLEDNKILHKVYIQDSYDFSQYLVYIRFEDEIKHNNFMQYIKRFNILNDPYALNAGYYVCDYCLNLMDNQLQFFDESLTIESLLNDKRFNIY